MQNQGITFCLCCQNGVPLLELVNCTIVLLFIFFFLNLGEILTHQKGNLSLLTAGRGQQLNEMLTSV